MEIGDKVKISFGKKGEKKEGTVVQLFPKTVVLKVDFPKHKEKILRRKRSQIS